MKQVIYVDVLFALNMIISFFMIKSAAFLCREKPSTLRVLTGSLLGGAYSLGIFLPPLNIVFVFVARSVFLGFVCFCVFGFGSLKRFFRCFGLLSGVSMGFAGVITALYFLIKPHGLAVRNGAVYLDISFIALVLGGAVFYIAAWIFGKVFTKNRSEQMRVEVVISYKDKKVNADGLIDTGNTLKDSFSGKSVSVIDRKLALSLLPLECAASVFSPVGCSLPEGMHFTVSNTVGGSSLMCVFVADSMEILSDAGVARLKNVPVAVGAVDDFGSGCSVLLNADIENYIMGGREYGKKNPRVDKKVKGKNPTEGRVLHKRPRNSACTVDVTAGERGDEPN